MKIRTSINSGQGLGDVIADITHLTGLDKLAGFYEQITGKNCGCEDRQKTLNLRFPLPSKTA
jgi:hypothetical protein